MSWCEANGVDYVFGLARNARLVAEIDDRAGRGRSRAWRNRPAGPPLQRLHCTPRSTAGAASAGSSARPSTWPRARTRASSSPRSRAAEIDAPHPLRGDLLRPRRDGEPDQGAASSTCSPTAPRPPPCAPTSSGCGSPRSPTCCSRAAPHRPAPHPVRQRHLRHDPPQAPEDRRPGPDQRAPHQGRHACLRPTEVVAAACPYRDEYHLAYLYLKRAAF